jgi:serine/threonine protein kinase
VASALRHVHRHKVLHRDIKASNVFLHKIETADGAPHSRRERQAPHVHWHTPRAAPAHAAPEAAAAAAARSR